MTFVESSPLASPLLREFRSNGLFRFITLPNVITQFWDDYSVFFPGVMQYKEKCELCFKQTSKLANFSPANGYVSQTVTDLPFCLGNRTIDPHEQSTAPFSPQGGETRYETPISDNPFENLPECKWSMVLESTISTFVFSRHSKQTGT